MTSRAPKFLPPGALQAELLRTEKHRSSCQTAVQKAQEVVQSAHKKLTEALNRLEASKLVFESYSESRDDIQVNADILAHLVKTLSASHKRKEEELERLAEQLSQAEEELRGVEKDVQTCKGVEELAKTSLSEAQEKYKKALQEYEKTYARANPPPEPVTPVNDSVPDKDRKEEQKDSGAEGARKRSNSPRRDLKNRRAPRRRSPTPVRSSKRSRRETRSRSRDRRRRRTRSRSWSADHRRTKKPEKEVAKQSNAKTSAKKADRVEASSEKRGKGAASEKEGPQGKAARSPPNHALQEKNDGEKEAHTANGKHSDTSDAPLQNGQGENGGGAKEHDGAIGRTSQEREQEKARDSSAESSGRRDSSASPSGRSRSLSGGPSAKRRARSRSTSSRSVSSTPVRRKRRELSSSPAGRTRRKLSGSRSPLVSPRTRSRRSESPPPRRRRSRSRSRRRSVSRSRSRSRNRARRSPRLEKIDSYTMDLFRSSLRKCLESHLIPFNISLINDVMRKEDRSWNIRRLNTTFLTFMKKLEDEGYVDLATRGSTTMVAGSARYRDIVEATNERLTWARYERRSRSRSRSRARSPPSGRRRTRSPPRRSRSPPRRSRRSPSRVRSASPRTRRSPSPRRARQGTPLKGGERWAMGGGGERWEMT